MTMDDSEQESGDCTIGNLSQDERLMLVEIAQALRNRATRTRVARYALDRVAAQLTRTAARIS